MADDPVYTGSAGIKLRSADGDEEIVTTASLADKGFHLYYDKNTPTPQEFKLTKNGIAWTNGTLAYSTPLDKLSAIQTAFAAVREPPNSSTLKVDNTLLLDNGSSQGTIDATNLRYEDPSNPSQKYLQIFGSSTNSILLQDTVAPNNDTVYIQATGIDVDDFTSGKQTAISGTQIRLRENSFPNRVNTLEPNQISMTNGGFQTNVSGGVVSVQASGQGNTFIATSGLYVNQQGLGGVGNAAISLQNSWSDTSSAAFVYEEVYRNKQALGVAGDRLYQHSVWGRDGAYTKTEFTRVTHTIRDPSDTAEDGSIEFQCLMNGQMQTFMQINGNDGGIGEVNVFKGLDLIGADAGLVKVSGTGSGNLTIDGSSSAGTGSVIINTKNGTAGSGNGLRLTGNTLISPTAGGNANQHLCITINNVVYKIALLNA